MGFFHIPQHRIYSPPGRWPFPAAEIEISATMETWSSFNGVLSHPRSTEFILRLAAGLFLPRRLKSPLLWKRGLPLMGFFHIPAAQNLFSAWPLAFSCRGD
jgi:hypothetical protein